MPGERLKGAIEVQRLGKNGEGKGRGPKDTAKGRTGKRHRGRPNAISRGPGTRCRGTSRRG